ncbi:MAG: HNH endonuclease [Nitrospirae bacterium]|nr:HNH endonuclease [Nitrospirota bacterium]
MPARICGIEKEQYIRPASIIYRPEGQENYPAPEPTAVSGIGFLNLATREVMAKKFPPGRCTHCLNFFDKLTADHVFPKSWYPESTPENLEKWQIPACHRCNEEYGKIENDLLQRIGLCLDPIEISSLGITDKVLRSIKPEYATSKKDRLHRQKKREKLIRSLMPRNQVPQEAFFPGFGAPSDRNILGNFVVRVPKAGIKALAEKLVRGITFIVDNRFIEKSHFIDLIVADEKSAQDLIEIIRRFGDQYHKGPGIRIGRAVAQDNIDSAVFEIEIWRRFRFYATVEPRESS